MQINWNIRQPLKGAATLIALFALAIALVACGGNEDSASAAELSALDATVAAQSAEIQALSAQISSLQSELAAASTATSGRSRRSAAAHGCGRRGRRAN